MIKDDLISINTNPIQPGNGNTLLKTVTVAGPDKEGDRRFYLDKKTLLQLAEIASSSILQRVQINRAGIQVQLYQSKNGHTYEVWKIVGLEPVPESSMDGLLSNLSNS